jgi:hypothetical protein
VVTDKVNTKNISSAALHPLSALPRLSRAKDVNDFSNVRRRLLPLQASWVGFRRFGLTRWLNGKQLVRAGCVEIDLIIFTERAVLIAELSKVFLPHKKTQFFVRDKLTESVSGQDLTGHPPLRLRAQIPLAESGDSSDFFVQIFAFRQTF